MPRNPSSHITMVTRTYVPTKGSCAVMPAERCRRLSSRSESPPPEQQSLPPQRSHGEPRHRHHNRTHDKTQAHTGFPLQLAQAHHFIPYGASPRYFPLPPSVLPHNGFTLHHPWTPARPLHDFGYGPAPLFGWDSAIPLAHGYGQPKYARHVKPDYRRFCFSVGKADVPYAALPGGPLWGYPTTMSPQLVGRW